MLRVGLFGDSLAVGVGASSPQDGLGPRLVADLAAAGRAAQHRVFAASGARSAALPGQVAAAGDWPHLAVVVIGANDLTHLVPVAQAVADLDAALRALRGRGIQVVLVPAPDLSSVAHVPPALRELVRLASATLRGAQEEVARATGAHLVDTSTASAALARDASLFSADRFHPSSAGYALLGQAVAPVVRTAARAVEDAA
ncbi:SGNH/GDSL hydrolase family protein [Kineococcus sp. SYSU DK003]|uniref:SGNH/GDSL hydrolase family protein n=1 Tax=Kineococcus sp. SYSU DK003 TaxID=3383124 RepID=UPI003D7E492F